MDLGLLTRPPVLCTTSFSSLIQSINSNADYGIPSVRAAHVARILLPDVRIYYLFYTDSVAEYRFPLAWRMAIE